MNLDGGDILEFLPNGEEMVILPEITTGESEEIEDGVIEEVEHGLDHDTSASDNPAE